MRKFIPLLLLAIIAYSYKKPIENTSKEKVVIGYIFVPDTLVDVSNIPANKFTHINYAFANIKDGIVIEGFKYDAENYKALNSLKAQNPNLKLLASVGGWTWSKNFSDVALTDESRSKFAKSAREFLIKHKLDGIDIDWEYPNQIGDSNKYRPEDVKNFTRLMKEIRKELDEQGKIDNKHYITSAACGAEPDFIKNTQMGKAQKYMDYVNLMTYDFYLGFVDPITGHHSGLFTNPNDPKLISGDAAVKMFVKAGVPIKKLVLGFPFHGSAWGKVEPKMNGLYQKGSGIFINTMHSAIVNDLLNDYGKYKRCWDDTAQAAYLWNSTDSIFISYDDIESVTKKCNYIKKNNMPGAMFWAYGADFENSILNTLNLELRPEVCNINKINSSKLGAGFRFSSYGSPTTDTTYWVNVGRTMAKNYKGATPECVWIVGTLYKKGCKLSFPVSPMVKMIQGSNEDIYEKILSAFDRESFRVWLQVEPGYASVDTLIDLVLKQYSHHKSVIGVGVDVEWNKSTSADEGQAISDQEAERWLKIARSYNKDYRMFLKHWLEDKMPPTVRDGIVFINDGQMFSSLDQMVKEFTNWGKTFYPSPVGFQIGYPADRKWWGKYENPPLTLGKHLIENIPNTSTIFWVNFGITNVFPIDKMK